MFVAPLAVMLSVCATGIGVWATAVTLLTGVTVVLRSAPKRRVLRETPGITVLRPCEGAETGLKSALKSSFTAAWAGPREVVICTPNADDPASAVARELLLEHPGVGRLVHDVPEAAAWRNPKARRLCGAWAEVRQPIVVQADADVVIDDQGLEQLIAAIEPGVAAAWAAPVVGAAPTWGSRVMRAAMGGSFYALSVMSGLNASLGAPPALSGALLAFRKDALPNGYAAAANDIGDDLALGQELSRHGTIALSGCAVICDRRALELPAVRAMLRRWIRVATAPVPARLLGFPTMLSATPPVLVLAPVALLIGAPAWVLGAVGTAIVARLAGQMIVRRELTGDAIGPTVLLDTVLGEAVVLDAAAGAAWDALRRRDIRWRNRNYTLGTGGNIVAVHDAQPAAERRPLERAP